MMDLTKLSDSDLMALKSGDLSKVSDAGLMVMKGQSFTPREHSAAQNVAGGVLKGASEIGTTLMTPIDAAARAMGIQNSFIGRDDRRQAVDQFMKQQGVDTNSLGYGAAKIGTEIAGTAGVGGTMAKGASMIPGAATKAPALIEALRTGGMSGGGLATRMLGGAATGGAAASLVNPEAGDMGAAFGAALPVAGKLIQGSSKLAKTAIGGTTGVGEEALSQAFQAGRAGGGAAKNFTESMRGTSNMDDVLQMAKQNLDVMGQQKQQAYRQGMTNVKADKTVLSLSKVDQAVNDALGMATYKGQIKNEKAAQALAQIKGEVDNWKSLDPEQFHTPEGLDALKQKIGGIIEGIPFEQKTAHSAASKVYDSLRSEISQQAPEYSKVMKDYSEASDLIKEVERSLSLGKKASADTAMRKLQSLMRNNVNTNYGQRTQLADELRKAGGQDFMPSLAGQALRPAIPRGFQSALTGTGGAGLALTGNVPAALGLAAVSSPRLMGETFYGAGKAVGLVNPALIEALRGAGYKVAPIAATLQDQQ